MMSQTFVLGASFNLKESKQSALTQLICCHGGASVHLSSRVVNFTVTSIGKEERNHDGGGV